MPLIESDEPGPSTVVQVYGKPVRVSKQSRQSAVPGPQRGYSNLERAVMSRTPSPAPLQVSQYADPRRYERVMEVLAAEQRATKAAEQEAAQKKWAAEKPWARVPGWGNWNLSSLNTTTPDLVNDPEWHDYLGFVPDREGPVVPAETYVKPGSTAQADVPVNNTQITDPVTGAVSQRPVRPLTVDEIAYLTDQGWTKPENIGIPTVGGEPLITSAVTPRNLTPYSYEFSDEQRDNLYREVLSQAAADAGFVPPSSWGTQVGTEGKSNTTRQVRELTWDEYDKLPRNARIALDVNGLMIDAREKDIKMPYSFANEEEEKKHINDVNTMFGEDGASLNPGYHTVQLFKQLELKGLEDHDLDEYLSLERAFTEDDIKRMAVSTKAVDSLKSLYGNDKPEAVGSGTRPEKYEQVRSIENMTAFDKSILEQAGAAISAIMQKSETNWSVQSALAGVGLGDYLPDNVPFGWGSPASGNTVRTNELDSNLENWYASTGYDYLRSTGAGLASAEKDMVEYEFTPADREGFRRYVDWRTRNEIQYGTPASKDPTGQVRSPVEIRKLLNLPEVKE